MQRSIRFVVLSIVLLVLGLLIGPAGAQEAPDSPDVAACLPGAGYASGCDVDQDGDVDIFDIQLTAGRWNTSGAYTSSHTHWGETWTGTGSHGLRMENTVASGVAYGIYGKSVSTGGVGVYGEAGAGSGDTWGVYGWSQSTAGHGVYGNASASSGVTYGVYGRSLSTDGRGVYGNATATTGITYGVYGQSASISGRGVVGLATATTGLTTGVAGESISTDGRGLYGHAGALSGTTIGVYGQSDSPAGYAGYFLGRVHVNGNLSKGGGSFKIDHPLDPANQYLYHSFVESPDMMNIYNGNVALDDQGEARVEMPDWFEALNQDFRYQLTPIGGWAPLYIAQEIENNAFRIAGGEPGMKVSWMVTGIRHDAYANAHRIPVEEAKPAEERGLYLHPVELGQPAELGLDYQRNLDRSREMP